jgi:hypothetical protein
VRETTTQSLNARESIFPDVASTCEATFGVKCVEETKFLLEDFVEAIFF